MNVIPLTNNRDWKWHRDRIAAVWGKQVASIVETGQALIDAKEELEHGSFEAMVQSKLPVGPRTAQRLMVIARHPILSNATHGSHFPPSWRTLFELTKVPDATLMEKLKDSSIHPKLERKDVAAMRSDVKSKPKPPTRDELIAAIKNDPLANQRDAAAQLGVSLGLYQRTRNELIGSGYIQGTLTIEELRERMIALLRGLSKDERMRDVERTMKALDLNIHDWVSTMTISKKGR
jgi:hypothetical protein